MLQLSIIETHCQGLSRERQRQGQREKGTPRAKARRATGRGTAAKFSGVAKADLQGVEGWRVEDNAGHVVKMDTCRRNVDGEALASTRMMQTAE